VEDGPIEDEYEEMTMEEIFTGKVIIYSLPAAFTS
jgi:peroxiredoxin